MNYSILRTCHHWHLTVSITRQNISGYETSPYGPMVQHMASSCLLFRVTTTFNFY